MADLRFNDLPDDLEQPDEQSLGAIKQIPGARASPATLFDSTPTQKPSWAAVCLALLDHAEQPPETKLNTLMGHLRSGDDAPIELVFALQDKLRTKLADWNKELAAASLRKRFQYCLRHLRDRIEVHIESTSSTPFVYSNKGHPESDWLSLIRPGDIILMRRIHSNALRKIVEPRDCLLSEIAGSDFSSVGLVAEDSVTQTKYLLAMGLTGAHAFPLSTLQHGDLARAQIMRAQDLHKRVSIQDAAQEKCHQLLGTYGPALQVPFDLTFNDRNVLKQHAAQFVAQTLLLKDITVTPHKTTLDPKFDALRLQLSLSNTAFITPGSFELDDQFEVVANFTHPKISMPLRARQAAYAAWCSQSDPQIPPANSSALWAGSFYRLLGQLTFSIPSLTRRDMGSSTLSTLIAFSQSMQPIIDDLESAQEVGLAEAKQTLMRCNLEQVAAEML